MTVPGFESETAPITKPKGKDEEEKVRYHYDSLPEFVDWFLTANPQEPGKARWCAHWWEHEDALNRLLALWDNWEHARLDPVHMSGWFRDHNDYVVAFLFGERGPFLYCTPGDDENPPVHVVKRFRLPTPIQPPAAVFRIGHQDQ